MTATAEIDLLLDATLPHPTDQNVSGIRKHISTNVDWSKLLQLAIPHGVLALLGRNLSTYAADLVPTQTIAQLELFGRKVASRSQRQAHELVRLLDGFSEDGILALPFKGPTLALTAYGDVALRESHDLDLWVWPIQFVRAGDWLRAAGYRPVNHQRGVARPSQDLGDRQAEFVSPDGQILVELNQHLEQSAYSCAFRPAFEYVWDRRREATIQGRRIPVFDAGDLLPALAVHGSKHRWRRLNWIVDVAALISSGCAIDWAEVLHNSKRWGCQRRFLVAVALAKELYHIEVPFDCRVLPHAAAVGKLASGIRLELFGSQTVRTFQSFSSDLRYHIRSCDCAFDRSHVIWRAVQRIMRADEAAMLLPLSTNLRRVHRFTSAIRKPWAH